MNRRGILGMLGMGAVAGPAVVSQLGSQGSVLAIPSTGGEIYKDQAIPWNPVEQLAQARKEYDIMTKDPAAWIEEYIQLEMREYLDGYGFAYDRIPADIRAMKSLSEQTKVRLHFERKARRRYEHNKGHIWDRIQEYIKMV